MAGGLVIHEAKKSGAKVDADVLSNGGITTGSGGKGKEKEKEKIWDLPKSKEVKKLEGIIEELKILQSGEAKSSSEEGSLECFCQGVLFVIYWESSSDTVISSSPSSSIALYTPMRQLRTHSMSSPTTSHAMSIMSQSPSNSAPNLQTDHETTRRHRESARI